MYEKIIIANIDFGSIEDSVADQLSPWRFSIGKLSLVAMEAYADLIAFITAEINSEFDETSLICGIIKDPLYNNTIIEKSFEIQRKILTHPSYLVCYEIGDHIASCVFLRNIVLSALDFVHDISREVKDMRTLFPGLERRDVVVERNGDLIVLSIGPEKGPKLVK